MDTMNTDDQNDDVVFEASTEEGEALSGSEKIKKLQEKIKGLEKEKQEYLDGWQRARADYANLQKAHDEDKKRLKELFAGNIIADFIPTIDSFQMAMANKDAWEKVDANWRTGVEYIYNQLIAALETHGLTMFGAVGDIFDPAKHEGVSEEETDDAAKDHTVAKVVQKGFMLGDVIPRPARVVVWVKK